MSEKQPDAQEASTGGGRKLADFRLLGVVSTATAHSKRLTLREALSGDQPLLVPGVTDAMGARLVQRQGFDAAYVTGAGIANAQYGLPDIGLVSMGEVVEQVGRVAASTDLPLIVDADTGYGGPLSAARTLRLLERAGATAVQLEDQEMPKRCGHFDDHALIPAEHMQSKIAAAVQARGDESLSVVARTDARGVHGLDEALRRAHLYTEAGADILFVEAPRSVDELELIGKRLRGIPLVVNVVEGGKTPELSLSEYHRLGFDVILYANFLMRAMMRAGRDALSHLGQNGASAGFSDQIATWEERQELFNLSGFNAASAYYDRPWSDR